MLDFKKYLLEKTLDRKKIYDVIKKEPKEKNPKPQEKSYEKNIKKELLSFLLRDKKQFIKKISKKYKVPNDIIKELQKEILPISELDDETNKEYASDIAILYSIFKKYLSYKKNIIKKEEYEEKQSYPLGTIKNLINQGKTLGEVADHFNIPKSTMAKKIKDIHQTSFTNLKKELNK